MNEDEDENASATFQEIVDDHFPILEGLDNLFDPNDLDFPLIIEGFDKIIEGFFPLIWQTKEYKDSNNYPMVNYIRIFFQDYLEPLLKSRFLENPVDTSFHIKYILKRLDKTIQTLKAVIDHLNKDGDTYEILSDKIDDCAYELEITLNNLACYTHDIKLESIWKNSIDLKPNSSPEKETKPTAKIWSLDTRFEYLKNAFPQAYQSIDKIKDKNHRYFAMAQLMNCSIDNAKHLLNGTYLGHNRRRNEDQIEIMQDFVLDHFNKNK